MKNTSESSAILTSIENQVLIIQLNRPDKKNALTIEMYQQLTHFLSEGDLDPNVRVIMLRGSDTCFTSGNDLHVFKNATTQTNKHGDQDRGDLSAIFTFLKTLSTTKKPIIAAVNGLAIGIGTTALLHCDLVYAGADTHFQMPFVDLGLCPEAASSYLLPRIIGHARASELLLLSTPLDARKALSFGIINGIFSTAELYSKVIEIAQAIAQKPPQSVQQTKALLKLSHVLPIRDAIQTESDAFTKLLNAPEAKEAFSAFFEKRKADFSNL